MLWSLWPIFKILCKIFTIIVIKKKQTFFGGVILHGKKQMHIEYGPDRGGTGSRGPAAIPLQSNWRPQRGD